MGKHLVIGVYSLMYYCRYKNWLELDKAVLDPVQDLPKGTDPIRLHFAFKYSFPSIPHSLSLFIL